MFSNISIQMSSMEYFSYILPYGVSSEPGGRKDHCEDMMLSIVCLNVWKGECKCSWTVSCYNTVKFGLFDCG